MRQPGLFEGLAGFATALSFVTMVVFFSALSEAGELIEIAHPELNTNGEVNNFIDSHPTDPLVKDFHAWVSRVGYSFISTVGFFLVNRFASAYRA